MSNLKCLFPLAALVACLPLTAATVNVDLSAAVNGTLITAPGASFAQTFAGQTASGTGSPASPLALQPSGLLTVESWDPGVSPASNSILSQPGNRGPLSVLLDSNADAATFTAGTADGGDPITLSLFDANGNLVDTLTPTLLPGYAVYSFSGPTFQGFTISGDFDSEGLRFQNFSYETAATPEPNCLPIVGLTLLGLGVARRRARS